MVSCQLTCNVILPALTSYTATLAQIGSLVEETLGGIDRDLTSDLSKSKLNLITGMQRYARAHVPDRSIKMSLTASSAKHLIGQM